MEGLISVIVPLYNAEKYVDMIIPCLLRQTYSNFELILVNDGSTDSTTEKIQKYRTQDNRVKIFEQENQGVAAARNRGLSEATGVYISYVDADDYILDDYLQRMYEYALIEDCDVVCCGCIQTEGNYSLIPMGEYPTVKRDRVIENKIDVLKDYKQNDEQYGCVVWAKLIKKELATKAYFEPLKYGEDQQYMMRILQYAHRIGLMQYQGYFYIRWDASATVGKSSMNEGRLFDGIAVAITYKELCENAEEEELIAAANRRYGNAVALAMHGSTLLSLKDYRKWRTRLLNYAHSVLCMKDYPKHKKADALLYCYAKLLYYWLMRFVGIEKDKTV